MKTYAIDWGHGDKLVVFDGTTPTHPNASLAEVITQLAPCRIVTESTFASYHRKERNEIIDLAQALGVEILCVAPRQTYRYRKEHGLEKSDEGDAKVIYAIWQEGEVHLAAPKRVVERELTRKDKVELLRRRGWPKKAAVEFLSHIPEVKAMPAHIRDVLGDGKGKITPAFVIPLIAAALDTIDEGGNRGQYERRVGCYGHGYPSLLRSHFYYHRLKALCNRVEKGSVSQRAVRKAQMRALRRATRWVFHCVRATVAREKSEKIAA